VRHRTSRLAARKRRSAPSLARKATEEKLATRLAKVTERLEADAPGMERSGADLIAWYLSPGRFPAGEQRSRQHAHTQRRLCERFVAPVIASLAGQDIRVADMQRIVNGAPTVQEGGRLHALVSALVGSGIRDGYLANARSTRPGAPSPSTARSSRSAAGRTRRRRRTASGGAPSTRAGPPRATRWPTGSPPVSRQHAASRDQPAEPDVPLAQGPVLAGE
jgi:hypothetical protein